MTERQLRIASGLSLPLDAVTQTFGILARKGAGKTYTAAVFAEELIGAGLPVVILDPLGAFWGLRSSADGEKPGLPVTILGGEHGDVPLDPHAGKVIADLVVEQPGAYILDLSSFESNKAQDSFVTAFAERLYRLKAAERSPLHLIVDEADSFAPQRPMPGQQRMLGAFEAIVRRGRIRGLGVTLITQRPAVLNKNVLTQVECLITLQITAPQDRKAIDEWVAGNGTKEERDELVASLAALQKGEAWFWSPSWLQVFTRAQVRLRRTFDSSKTPEAGEVIEPKRMAPVDLERLRVRMADAIAKAEAEDPRKLQARIRELERQAAQRPPEQVTETVVERVEVPVLNGQVGELKEIVRELVDFGQTIAGVGDRIIQAIDRVQGAPRTPPVGGGERRGTSREVAPQSPTGRRPAVSAPPVAVVERSEGARALGKAERSILSVLAQFDSRTQTQVALLTGYSANGGGFRNALGALRSTGYVEGGRDDLRITDAGHQAVREVLGGVQPLPTGEELLQHWLAHPQLGKAERLILETLWGAYPRSMTQEEAAEATGYEATGGGFRNALGRLRTLQLIHGGRDALRASEDLF
jgi:hypothetical protein